MSFDSKAPLAPPRVSMIGVDDRRHAFIFHDKDLVILPRLRPRQTIGQQLLPEGASAAV